MWELDSLWNKRFTYQKLRDEVCLIESKLHTTVFLGLFTDTV